MRKGATLIEIMVAVALLVVVIVGLLATLVYCIGLSESNSNLVIAALDAQSAMEELKNQPYADIIQGYTPQQYANLVEETITVSVNEENGYKEVRVDVSWSERGGQKSFALISYYVP